MESSRWGARFLALLAGGLAVLSQPPFSFPWVLGLALPGLFWLWHSAITPARAFWIGWFAGLGYFSGTLHWIAEPFLVQPEIYGWMIPFAVSGMAGGMALFWGTGFWLAQRIRSSGWGSPFALTFALVGMEWLRGNILSGFPWSLLGYTWVETSALSLAADIGIYGLTLWTVLIGMMLGYILILNGFLSRVGYFVLVILVLGLPLLHANLNASRLSTFEGTGSGQAQTGPLIGLVQPNVAQRDKWQPHLREAHLQDLLDKTRELSAQGADVVVWPEAATPYQLDQIPELQRIIGEALKPGAVLLAGAVRFEGQNAFNSLIAIGSDGTVLDIYDKQHLVPFGEMIPLEPLLSRLGLRAMISLPGGFTSGAARERSVTVAGLPSFVPMICYEAIFPAEIMRRAAKNDWLVHVTNDAWFGNWVGPYQHLAMVRFRAAERGLPVGRSANTGVSAIIDAHGRIVASLLLNESGTLLEKLPKRLPETTYSRYEDIPFGFALLITLLLAVFGKGRPQRLRSEHKV